MYGLECMRDTFLTTYAINTSSLLLELSHRLIADRRPSSLFTLLYVISFAKRKYLYGQHLNVHIDTHH